MRRFAELGHGVTRVSDLATPLSAVQASASYTITTNSLMRAPVKAAALISSSLTTALPHEIVLVLDFITILDFTLVGV